MRGGEVGAEVVRARLQEGERAGEFVPEVWAFVTIVA